MTTRWEPDYGWIGVDLDETLAHSTGWKPGDPEHRIGEPIERMVRRVKRWLKHGRKMPDGRVIKDIRIFTARASRFDRVPEMLPAIEAWCLKHLGQVLPVTATKTYGLVEFWDDRAVRVEAGTGRRVK